MDVFLNALFEQLSRGTLLKKGVVQSDSNTDNSWTEAFIVSYHDDENNSLPNVNPQLVSVLQVTAPKTPKSCFHLSFTWRSSSTSTNTSTTINVPENEVWSD